MLKINFGEIHNLKARNIKARNIHFISLKINKRILEAYLNPQFQFFTSTVRFVFQINTFS